MRSHTLALGWEFRKRHSWPLIALAAYLMVLAALKILGLGPVDAIRLVPPDGRGAVLIAPLSTAFMYYLGVCSFGLSGDLAARHSIYPARLFTLPMRTESLVLAPMLHGTVAVALLVEAATVVARWPWGLETPLIWPALLAAVFLAWTQALTWMPYGLPGVRVVVTVLWLAALDAVVLGAMYFKVTEPVMLAILAPQLPLAYLTARYAVARARRGDVPDWRPGLWRPGLWRPAAVAGTVAPSAGFASPARAQSWFEWRRQGRTLPALVAIVLPFELALFWLARDAPLLVLELLLLALITPPILSGFSAAMVSKASPHARDSLAMSPFIATRPLSSPALVGARLRMAAWSTLATWTLVLVAIPIALVWSGNWSVLSDRASRLAAVVGMPRMLVFALLVLAGLIASTWKQLVQSLHVSLGGREWIATARLMAALAFIILVGPLVQWVIEHDSARAAAWNSLPVILGVLVACKMGAAYWVVVRLARSGLLTDRALVCGAACWVVVVGALYGVLAWLVDGPLVPQYFLLLLAILFVPLARISAAPLALARNRHR
jgi:hypothetical protein